MGRLSRVCDRTFAHGVLDAGDMWQTTQSLRDMTYEFRQLGISYLPPCEQPSASVLLKTIK